MRHAMGNAVGKRGQITIEREIREQHMHSLAGNLGPSPVQPREPLDIDDAVARGVAEEWRRTLEGESVEGSGTVGRAHPRRRSP